jgi:hypothetical protein
MDHTLFNNLHSEGFISDESFTKIKQRHQTKLFSVHWEIKTILYLGIILLTSGLGILVYKNIDTIGHQAILAFIALICAGCFYYCFKHKAPFSKERVQSAKPFFDYVLLLGATMFIIFVGYLQYQYQVFGLHYGMATFIPMLVLFYIAYDFDHLGILNMAITNLAIWLGVSVTPKTLLAYGTFNSQNIIYTYIGFALLLLMLGWVTDRLALKKHFKFSYHHYGVHVSFIALLAAYFYNYNDAASMLWIVGLGLLAVLLYQNAYELKSFYFLVLIVLYSYAAASCLVIRMLIATADTGAIYLLFIYFILSAIGCVLLLRYLNRQLQNV